MLNAVSALDSPMLGQQAEIFMGARPQKAATGDANVFLFE
jgi:hypothetical protein